MFDDHHYEDFGEDDGDRKKLFLAMLIPAVIVVIVGGGIIWYLSSQDRVDEIDDIIVDDTTETDTNYLEDNEDRVDALTLMAKALEEYEALNEEYPSIKEVESVIEDSNYFDKIPVDARQGEFDKAGKLMGYTYAVYDTIAGDDTAYIVSALFEDSRGFGYAWTRGASTKNYTDYRDVEENHVTLIGSDDDDIGTYEPEPEPETNDDEDNDDDSSTMGPKVPQ